MNKNIVVWLVMLLSSYPVYNQNIDSTLIKAYKYKSKIILDEFFINWQNSNKLSDEQILSTNESKKSNDTLSEIYNLMNSFYNPVSNGNKYFIALDSLNFDVCYSDTIPPHDNPQGKKCIVRSNNIVPFRIEQDGGSSEVLYLNDKYYNTIIDFFKSPYPEFKKTKIDYKAKVSFFSGYLLIVGKGNLQPNAIYKRALLSDPIIENAVINHKLNMAMVYYTIGCAFMESEWKKIDDRWIKIRETCIDIC